MVTDLIFGMYNKPLLPNIDLQSICTIERKQPADSVNKADHSACSDLKTTCHSSFPSLSISFDCRKCNFFRNRIW